MISVWFIVLLLVTIALSVLIFRNIDRYKTADTICEKRRANQELGALLALQLAVAGMWILAVVAS